MSFILSIHPLKHRWRRLLLALILILIGLLTYRKLSPDSEVLGEADFSPVYIIDAGHGGEDGGAISVTGTSESQINLAIALKLEQLFALYGHCPILVRREDISIYDPGSESLHEKKVSDIQNRVSLVESTPNAILISIHQNSYPDSQYDGFQVFYAPTANSQELAEVVQTSLKSNLNPENSREVKQIYDTVYLLNHISCPAILVECGFLTNPVEAEKLETDSYQMQLAASILAGVL